MKDLYNSQKSNLEISQHTLPNLKGSALHADPKYKQREYQICYIIIQYVACMNKYGVYIYIYIYLSLYIYIYTYSPTSRLHSFEGTSAFVYVYVHYAYVRLLSFTFTVSFSFVYVYFRLRLRLRSFTCTFTFPRYVLRDVFVYTESYYI